MSIFKFFTGVALALGVMMLVAYATQLRAFPGMNAYAIQTFLEECVRAPEVLVFRVLMASQDDEGNPTVSKDQAYEIAAKQCGYNLMGAMDA